MFPVIAEVVVVGQPRSGTGGRGEGQPPRIPYAKPGVGDAVLILADTERVHVPAVPAHHGQDDRVELGQAHPPDTWIRRQMGGLLPFIWILS
jgi:hypothetical protein